MEGDLRRVSFSELVLVNLREATNSEKTLQISSFIKENINF